MGKPRFLFVSWSASYPWFPMRNEDRPKKNREYLKEIRLESFWSRVNYGRRNPRWSLRKKLLSGVLSILQHAAGKKSKIKGRNQTNYQRHAKSERNWSHRNFLPRFAHVHHHDDAQVVVSAYAAVEHADDCEPDQIRFHGRAEHIELGKEAAGHRDPNQ